jgi:hypothetical protein
VYVIVGYEQSTLPRDGDALGWIAFQLRDALSTGRFAPSSDPTHGNTLN